jgi:hypothetical protein
MCWFSGCNCWCGSRFIWSGGLYSGIDYDLRPTLPLDLTPSPVPRSSVQRRRRPRGTPLSDLRVVARPLRHRSSSLPSAPCSRARAADAPPAPDLPSPLSSSPPSPILLWFWQGDSRRHGFFGARMTRRRLKNHSSIALSFSSISLGISKKCIITTRHKLETH